MFKQISPTYDLLNRTLSLGHDIYWRREMVKNLALSQNALVLDMATGTGDVAIEIVRQFNSKVSVVGIDFVFNMLLLGKEKIAQAGYGNNIRLMQGDVFNLPLKANIFDAVTIAFGIRNMADKEEVLRVFYSLLKKGGHALILELTRPEKGLMKNIYLAYFQKILPLAGKLISKDASAYKYLPESVMTFPHPLRLCKIMEEVGFCPVWHKPLTNGICTIISGKKPDA